ncbi:MAG: PIG-L family deacetylase [Microgenomates group bacterium]
MTNILNTPSEIIILSPHPDDAIFSLGQHIHNWLSSGQKLKIINIFNSFGTDDVFSENAWNYLLKYGYKNTIELSQSRSADNQNIYTNLNITPSNLDFIDASFRQFGSGPIYQTPQALNNGRPSTYDSDLPLEIINLLGLQTDQLILCPYGVGGHVDHSLVRRVGDILKKQKYSVKFYLESPYLWRDLNYLKYSLDILRATSYLREVTDKMELVKLYSYANQIVRRGESFPEVII